MEPWSASANYIAAVEVLAERGGNWTGTDKKHQNKHQIRMLNLPINYWQRNAMVENTKERRII